MRLLLDGVCYYRAEEWWTYELCFNKGVRQFHKEAPAAGAVGIAPDVADGPLTQISLGTFNAQLTDLNKVQVRLSHMCFLLLISNFSHVGVVLYT